MDKPLGLNSQLAQNFSNDELADVCFELGVEVEDLPSERRSRARELILLSGRLGRTDRLLDWLQRFRPNLQLYPYLFMIIKENFDVNGIMALCQRLQFNCQALRLSAIELGSDLSSNDFLKEEGVWRLQDHAMENGRFADLIAAIEQAKPGLKLDIFRTAAAAMGQQATLPAQGTSSTTTTTQQASSQTSGDVDVELDELIEYADFDIHIGLDRGDGTYEVNADSLGLQTQRIVQKLPLDDQNFQDIAAYLRDLIASADEAKEFGKALYKFLFPSDIDKLFSRNLGVAQEKGKKGLRVRLHIDRKATQLQQIPWEYCLDDRDYLALNTETPVVRYTPTDRSSKSISVPQKVRVLVVMASPAGMDTLDVKAETALIENALKKLTEAGRVEVKILSDATRGELRRVYRKYDPHILHFTGHGMLKEDGEGAIVLQDDNGNAQPVDASDMLKLTRSTSTKLVVLSACETAAVGKEAEAFMGVAPRLVWDGMPAVVAMQFAVPEEMARPFMQDFYEFLADGEPLETAITEARIGASFDDEDSIFWAIPVLFTRAPDGNMWA
ncbi:MAG: CHAT domain-containing protein [Anaerolineales bacterium]|nr:CHAT domain-containing protein [Anaerolineales bacterium]